ncbi:hypothetical protein Q3G72_022541 [Acer saccharum]|nr:hypothetical protein Q3G72_022541 [Acer saccharum]
MTRGKAGGGFRCRRRRLLPVEEAAVAAAVLVEMVVEGWVSDMIVFGDILRCVTFNQDYWSFGLPSYGQRPEGEKNFSERPCCHSRHHHRTATVAAAAFERPVVASAAEEPIRTGSDDRAAFVASTITPFLVELHLTDGDATIVSVGRFAAEIGYSKARSYGILKRKELFESLTDLYTNMFIGQWSAFKSVADTIEANQGSGSGQTSSSSNITDSLYTKAFHIAKIYISHWFVDLYSTNRDAYEKLSPPIALDQHFEHYQELYSHEYDFFLQQLNAVKHSLYH